MRDVAIWGNSIPGRRKDKYKDPVAGASSVCLRNSMQARGWSRERGRMAGDEVRWVAQGQIM